LGATIPFAGIGATVGKFGSKIDDLISGSHLLSESKKLLQLERPGGMAEANRLFDQLTAGQKVTEHVTPRGTVRSAELPGSVSVDVKWKMGSGLAVEHVIARSPVRDWRFHASMLDPTPPEDSRARLA
jgi:hypothetical protein